jgi:hypothetical protein
MLNCLSVSLQLSGASANCFSIRDPSDAAMRGVILPTGRGQSSSARVNPSAQYDEKPKNSGSNSRRPNGRMGRRLTNAPSSEVRRSGARLCDLLELDIGNVKPPAQRPLATRTVMDAIDCTGIQHKALSEHRAASYRFGCCTKVKCPTNFRSRRINGLRVAKRCCVLSHIMLLPVDS